MCLCPWACVCTRPVHCGAGPLSKPLLLYLLHYSSSRRFPQSGPVPPAPRYPSSFPTGRKIIWTFVFTSLIILSLSKSLNMLVIIHLWASQVALVVKNSPANAGDTGDAGSIPGFRRSTGVGYGTPLQYSCLENPMDKGAWRATVQRVAKCQAQLSH